MKSYCFLVVLLSTVTLISVREGSGEEEIDLVCNSYHTDKGILNGTEKCKTNDDSCFVLWREEVNERNETFQIVLKKGCFKVSAHNPSRICHDDCIQNPNYDVFKTKNVSGFCCCKVDMCNKNFTPVYYVELESTVAPASTAGESTSQQSDVTVTVVIACVMFVVLAIIMTAVVVYMYKVKCHTAKCTATRAEEREPLELPLDLSGLHFDRRGKTDSTL